MKRFFKFVSDSFGSFLDFYPKPNFNSIHQFDPDQSDEQAIQECWREAGNYLRFAINKFEEENAEEIRQAIERDHTA